MESANEILAGSHYFCKMLLVSEKGGYLDEGLALRRLYDNSIQTILKKDDLNFRENCSTIKYRPLRTSKLNLIIYNKRIHIWNDEPVL